MKQIIKITLLLVLITFPGWAVAINSNPTHTHTNTPMELGFVSDNLGIRYASVCFLGSGDCGGGSFGKGDEDMGVDNGDQCKNAGFDKACPVGWHPDLKPGKNCPYDPSYKTCCQEKCPENAATSCSGDDVGNDGCGYTCKKCCSTTCSVGYEYTESQLTGSSGTGWVKDGTGFCDHCTKGKLYKRKAATCPTSSNTCSCGGNYPCKAGNNTLYASCNCCSNCGSQYYLSKYPSKTDCPYGSDACYDYCSKSNKYSCKTTCTPSCSPSSPSDHNCSNYAIGYTGNCGETCYYCADNTYYIGTCSADNFTSGVITSCTGGCIGKYSGKSVDCSQYIGLECYEQMTEYKSTYECGW